MLVIFVLSEIFLNQHTS